MTGLPDLMWFGTTDGEWPIQCWADEVHARTWAAGGDGMRKRRIWKAGVVEPMEYELVAPEPRLEIKL